MAANLPFARFHMESFMSGGAAHHLERSDLRWASASEESFEGSGMKP